MNASEDSRRILAEHWLHQQATALAGLGWSVDPASLTAASSDASFRRYFRIAGKNPKINVFDPDGRAAR